MSNSIEDLQGKIEIEVLDKEKYLVDYYIYGDKSDINQYLEWLEFAKKNYNKLYGLLLEELLSWQERVEFEIWNECNYTFYPIGFDKKEEMHPYLGEPVIEIYDRDEKIYIGITFYKNNLISLEHGLSGVYEGDQLIKMDFTDCETILQCLNWKEEE